MREGTIVDATLTCAPPSTKNRNKARDPDMLSVQERQSVVFGDAGYQGVGKREENLDTAVSWNVAMKRGQRKALSDDELGQLREKAEKLKASIRAKVEHPLHVIKNLFKHRKTRYRGLPKNEAQLFALFGTANQVLARRRLLVVCAQGAS